MSFSFSLFLTSFLLLLLCVVTSPLPLCRCTRNRVCSLSFRSRFNRRDISVTQPLPSVTSAVFVRCNSTQHRATTSGEQPSSQPNSSYDPLSVQSSVSCITHKHSSQNPRVSNEQRRRLESVRHTLKSNLNHQFLAIFLRSTEQRTLHRSLDRTRVCKETFPRRPVLLAL